MIGALVCSSPVFAQGGTADISGTVFDQAKAVLPGATVTATNEATGQQRTAVTEADGRFSMPTLLPGIYTITAELQGFQTSSQQGLVVAVGQEITLNLTLRLAGVQENVVVTAEAPLIEATASRIGVNITTGDIDNLPAFNRSQFSLMQTIPGLVPALQVGSFEGGQFSANGQATTQSVSRRRPEQQRLPASAARRARRRVCRSTRWPNIRCKRTSTAPSTAGRPASS